MAYKFNPFTGNFDKVNTKASEISILDAGAYYTGTEVETALQEVGLTLSTITNPLLFRGSIAISSDFPLIGDVQIGWFYVVTANVTDNDVGHTNTGQSFIAGDEIAWDGSAWVELGSDVYWQRTGTQLTPANANDNVLIEKDYTSGGVTVAGVATSTTAIAGEITAGTFDTTSTHSSGTINSAFGVNGSATSGDGVVTTLRGGNYVADIGGSANSSTIVGSYGLARLTGSGVATSSAVGVFGDMRHEGTSNQVVNVGVFGSVTNAGNADMTLAGAIAAGEIDNQGSGTIANVYSFYGFQQAAGTNNWGVWCPNDWAIAGDNKLYLGAGQDSYIEYDGTDLVIDPQVVGTGNLSLLHGGIQFATGEATPTHSEGMISWNDDDKTLDIHTEVTGTKLQVGQEMFVRATNKTGVTITDGSVVYINGAQGSRPTIALADADAEATADATIGVVTADITDNSTGYITTFGLVRDIDTSAFTAGDTLYLSSTAGGLTNTMPTTPAHAVKVGVCLFSNGASGIIFVNVHNSGELSDLHDVLITSIADNDVLKWDAANSYWVNSTNASDSLAEVLTVGNTTGGTDIELTSGDVLTSDDSILNIQSAKTETGATPNTGDAGVVGFWKLDDGSGTSLADSGPNGYTGTLSGGSWVGSGYFGYAGDDSVSITTGTNNISLGDQNDFSFGNGSSDSPFSFQIWVKVDDNVGNQGLVTKWGSGGVDKREYVCYIVSGKINFWCRDDSASAYIGRRYDTALTPGTWYHVGGTYDGSSTEGGIKIYVNGVQVDDVSVSAGSYIAMEAGTSNLKVGNFNSNTAPLHGDIDCFVLYNDVRSAAEMLSDYQTGTGAATANVINTSTGYVGSTSKLLSIQNNDVEKSYFDLNGALTAPDLTIDTNLLVTDSTANTITINSTTAFDGVLDEDDLVSDSATKLATQQSIKAYVDTQVATVDTWAEILALGNTSGGTNVIVSAGDTLTVDTIAETTAAGGVTIDGLLIKDSAIGGATATEIGYTSGVTSAIQTQLDTKLANIIEDTTPQLGADLDCNGFDITLADSTTALTTGDYSANYNSGSTGTGAAPSQADANIVSYWTFDDNSVEPPNDDADLVAYWAFTEGSGTTLADSINSNTGTFAGNPAWNGSGPFATGDSVLFDNSGDWVDCGSGGSLALTGNYTIAAWFKASSVSDIGIIAGRFDDGVNPGAVIRMNADGKIRFFHYPVPGLNTIDSSAAYDDNAWHMVVATFEAGVGSELWVDGVSQGTSSSTTTAVASYTQSWRIGAQNNVTREFNGSIGHVSAYNATKTDAEIKQMYNMGLATKVADYVGENTGTITNATFDGSGYFGYTGDDSLSFNGTSAKVVTTDISELDGASTFTIQGWAKQDALDVDCGIVEKYTSATNRIALSPWSNGLMYVIVANTANTFGSFDYSTAVTAGEWFMWSMVFDGGGATNADKLKLYIDGVEQTLSFTGTIPATTGTGTATFDIGLQSNGGAAYWNGDIDNVIVYSDARSAAEVLSDYNNGLPSSNAHVFNTAATLSDTANLIQVKNNGTEKIALSGGGKITAVDLTIDTTLLVTDSTANTVNINSTTAIDGVLDEDNMASDSATKLATQQSIKAYVDTQITANDELGELTDVTITAVANGQVLTYDSGAGMWVNASNKNADGGFANSVYTAAQLINGGGAS